MFCSTRKVSTPTLQPIYSCYCSYLPHCGSFEFVFENDCFFMFVFIFNEPYTMQHLYLYRKSREYLVQFQWQESNRTQYYISLAIDSVFKKHFFFLSHWHSFSLSQNEICLLEAFISADVCHILLSAVLIGLQWSRRGHCWHVRHILSFIYFAEAKKRNAYL
jgi:hypothetical protein